MVWKDRTSPMEGFDVKCTRLGAQRRRSDLRREANRSQNNILDIYSFRDAKGKFFRQDMPTEGKVLSATGLQRRMLSV